MKRENENLDIRSLENELKNQYYRYQLALKDGAVGSIIAEVRRRIENLEERIQECKRESDLAVTYS